MTLKSLVAHVTDKERFTKLEDFVDFATAFLEFSATGLQAVIVSRNEPQYNFWQFKGDGSFNVSRPVNSNLMYLPADAGKAFKHFLPLLSAARASVAASAANRMTLNRTIYTLQQCIGIALDGLPAGKSNTARKINGDLFERLIRLTLLRAQIPCTTGVIKVPVTVDGAVAFEMNYQHDLIIKQGELVKAIGSVKTSSKDRLDKVFMDKFLFNRLTSSHVPHVAIFLNDVQRKGASPRDYGISATFLPDHFKGYTVKLNPLDGVYYFDIRPNMRTEPILKDHIRTFDHFLFNDVWGFLDHRGVPAKIE
ncbi:MAG: hypothetical protein JNM65_19750 [Verrucomicrobiaceae bacterium]|nr:hypothetical protein [Verrucomicrobiaceae bacterium]